MRNDEVGGGGEVKEKKRRKTKKKKRKTSNSTAGGKKRCRFHKKKKKRKRKKNRSGDRSRPVLTFSRFFLPFGIDGKGGGGDPKFKKKTKKNKQKKTQPKNSSVGNAKVISELKRSRLNDFNREIDLNIDHRRLIDDGSTISIDGSDRPRPTKNKRADAAEDAAEDAEDAEHAEHAEDDGEQEEEEEDVKKKTKRKRKRRPAKCPAERKRATYEQHQNSVKKNSVNIARGSFPSIKRIGYENKFQCTSRLCTASVL